MDIHVLKTYRGTDDTCAEAGDELPEHAVGFWQKNSFVVR